MRISLKLEIEKKNFDKVKMYSLRTRDKNLMNKTFDELHEKKRLK